jgi:hypothetical protein
LHGRGGLRLFESQGHQYQPYYQRKNDDCQAEIVVKQLRKGNQPIEDRV